MMPFPNAPAAHPTGVPTDRAVAMRLPEDLPEPGLLVGWSLEQEHRRQPVGFSFGNPQLTPDKGWLDPILLESEGHIITIAPTGTGKGRGCIIPALLRHEGPVIVIDPKGENVAVTARRRREMGQHVVVLDPMGITGEQAGGFNPLDLIDAESAGAVDLATMFADAMIDGKADPENQYWYQRAQHLLTGIFLHLASRPGTGERSFAKARGFLADVMAEQRLEPQFRQATNDMLVSPHPEARMAASVLQSSATEGLGSILSMTQDGVDFLRGPLIEKAIETSTFDLGAVTRGDPLSIYIVLPPHMMESHGRLLRLWVMALISLITRRRGKPARSTLFILDEAAQLGTLPQLRQAVTLLRGYGLQCWSLWQDVSQLRRLYPNDWETMVNNCRVVQCFGALNLMAAGAMAQLTGFGDAQAVLDLDDSEMLLQIAGDRAMRARKPDYLTDPPFAGLFDANPYHDPEQAIMPEPEPRVTLLPPPTPPVSAPDVPREAPPAGDPFIAELRRQEEEKQRRRRESEERAALPDPLHAKVWRDQAS
ncbi:type IV secretory system conjugative DNA transfer family protein [Altererythrobacter lauratis]|uniref:Type IV secretory system conjugative DNA transfer family protein n=1 Tax=Alteraurantiacibacter lauratis TaxID=2054627 RepID=A0ABV7EE02_9SPHN